MFIFTEIIIMLNMLIPATINDMPAIDPKRIPGEPVIDDTVWAISRTGNIVVLLL